MGDLIVENRLLTRKENNPAVNYGNILTVSVIRRMDADYRERIFVFLHDSGLENDFLKDFSFNNINLSNNSIQRLCFNKYKFINVDFSHSKLSYINFNNSHFENSDFSNCIFESVWFHQTTLLSCNFNNVEKLSLGGDSATTFSGCTFNNINNSFLDFGSSWFMGCEFKSSNLIFSDYPSSPSLLKNSHIIKCKFINCIIQLPYYHELDLRKNVFENTRITNTRITGLEIYQSEFIDYKIEKTRIKDCVLWEVKHNFTKSDINDLDMKNWRITNCFPRKEPTTILEIIRGKKD